jgi:hypothetical protein
LFGRDEEKKIMCGKTILASTKEKVLQKITKNSI